MFKKKSLYIVIMILIVSLSATMLMSCNGNARKPELGVVLEQYMQEPQKKATSTLILGVEMKGAFHLVNLNFKFNQILEMDRIYNNEKLVIAADGYVGEVDGILMILPLLPTEIADLLRKYAVNKETMFSALLGYDGVDTYNAKAGYYNKVDEKEYQTFIGIDENTIDQYQDALGFQPEVPLNLNQMLMMNDFFNIQDKPSFIISDSASPKFNDTENAYLYNFALDKNLLKSYYVQMMEDIMFSSLEEDMHEDNIEFYNQVKNIVLGWFSVEASSLRARVDSKGKLRGINTDIKFKIEIPNGELIQVANIFEPGLGSQVVNLIKDISLTVDFKFSETYAYDNASTNIDQFVAYDILKGKSVNLPDRTIIEFTDPFGEND